MDAEEIRPGDVIQVDPKMGLYGGCMAIVATVKEGEVQGFIVCPDDRGHAGTWVETWPRDAVVRIGRTAWTIGDALLVRPHGTHGTRISWL